MHVVQRGNNRKPCFVRRRDYSIYLAALLDSATRYHVDIHAYVLMTNHVHLLVTPRDNIGVSRMMQQMGRRYVRMFNNAHKRTGTLWEGRFHSSIIDTDRYLFACYRYIEHNPVRAGMVSAPGDYLWSSFKVNALGRASELITPRKEWIDLGKDKYERCNKYRSIVGSSLVDKSFDAIRFGTNKGLPVGSSQFINSIELKLSTTLGSGIQGRPKTGSEPNNGL